MDESIASGGGRGKNKRFWSAEEDNALISALSDLNADPHWKSDNKFRNGYMVRLEELIGKAIPGCGLKALPHIDSRLKTLVTKFRTIVQMLGTSGFKWDDEKHMISVERSVYDEYCKVHSNCKNLYGQSFPHFNALLEIYGKDCATGKPAEGLIDAIDNMERSGAEVLIDAIDNMERSDAEGLIDAIDNMEKSGAGGLIDAIDNMEKSGAEGFIDAIDNMEKSGAEGFIDAIDNMEKSGTVQVMIDSSDDEDTIISGNGNQTVESAPPFKKAKLENTSKRKRGKKEAGSASNPKLATLQAFMKDMNVHLSTMANVMSRADEREQQIAENSEKVLDVLLALDGVTPQQALEVAQILTAQPNKLMIFFKCPDALKCTFVKSLLP